MRARISHVTGYGWHAGRLLAWPALLVGSVVGFFASITLEVTLHVATGRDWPFALLGPAIVAWWLWRRVRRKLAGEPFVWDPVLDDAHEVELVHRHHDERRWRRLLRLELLAWGGTLLIHLALLSLWWTQEAGR